MARKKNVTNETVENVAWAAEQTRRAGDTRTAGRLARGAAELAREIPPANRGVVATVLAIAPLTPQ